MVDVVYSLGAEIEDGPTILNTDTIENLTAYEYLEFTVDAEGTATVDVQPGDSGDVAVFFMYSNYYDSLSYTVDGGSSISFDGPLVLVGTGPVKLLGSTCKVFVFTNGSTTYDSLVRIFAARTAED